MKKEKSNSSVVPLFAHHALHDAEIGGAFKVRPFRAASPTLTAPPFFRPYRVTGDGRERLRRGPPSKNICTKGKRQESKRQWPCSCLSYQISTLPCRFPIPSLCGHYPIYVPFNSRFAEIDLAVTGHIAASVGVIIGVQHEPFPVGQIVKVTAEAGSFPPNLEGQDCGSHHWPIGYFVLTRVQPFLKRPFVAEGSDSQIRQRKKSKLDG